MGKFRQIFTELSARDTPIFSFPDDNLNKQQGLLTRLAICIDIIKIWFRIAICPSVIFFPDIFATITLIHKQIIAMVGYYACGAFISISYSSVMLRESVSKITQELLHLGFEILYKHFV